LLSRRLLAALALALFMLVASVFFHNLRVMSADRQYVQQLMFMNDIGIVRGLMVLTAWGAGAFNLDARHAA
jgi:putative oxidoreductase